FHVTGVQTCALPICGPALDDAGRVEPAPVAGAEPALAEPFRLLRQREDLRDLGIALPDGELTAREPGNLAVVAVGAEHLVDPVQSGHRVRQRLPHGVGLPAADVEGEDGPHRLLHVTYRGGSLCRPGHRLSHRPGPGPTGGTSCSR